MTKINVGVQAMTIKDKFSELGAYEAIQQIAELGYTTIEISQIPMTPENIQEMKRGAEDFKVEIAAISASLIPPHNSDDDCLENDLDVFIEQCQTLNCRYIRIGMLPIHFLENKETVIEFAKRAEKVAKELAKENIKLCYHNHHHEFIKFEGRYVLDIIFEHAPSLGLEFDVHWGQRGGVNPLEIIKQYPGKLDLIHLKDFKVSPLETHYFDEMRLGNYEGVFEAFSQNIQFAPLGEGNLELLEMIDEALKSGSRYFFVEQDETYGEDTIECLRRSIDYLKSKNYVK